MAFEASVGPEIRLLGDVEVVVDGRPIDLGGPKPRLLLAMLAVARGQTVSADALAEQLWGERPTVDPVTGLQNLVSRTRRVLPIGIAILARDSGYALDAGATQVDADRRARPGTRSVAASVGVPDPRAQHRPGCPAGTNASGGGGHAGVPVHRHRGQHPPVGGRGGRGGWRCTPVPRRPATTAGSARR